MLFHWFWVRRSGFETPSAEDTGTSNTADTGDMMVPDTDNGVAAGDMTMAAIVKQPVTPVPRMLQTLLAKMRAPTR